MMEVFVFLFIVVVLVAVVKADSADRPGAPEERHHLFKMDQSPSDSAASDDHAISDFLHDNSSFPDMLNDPLYSHMPGNIYYHDSSSDDDHFIKRDDD